MDRVQRGGSWQKQTKWTAEELSAHGEDAREPHRWVDYRRVCDVGFRIASEHPQERVYNERGDRSER
jgi:hypothetical protein